MTSTDVRSDLRALLHAWTDAFNEHDPDKAVTFVSEDCTFSNVGTGERHIGREAMRESIANLLTMYSEVHFEVVGDVIDEDRWTKEWVLTGVHTGDMPGLPATGKPFRLVGAGVSTIRDGLIVDLTEYWNMADFLTQVGILPPATAR
jgi:steroid delta-isomerase-like uncharacterized protein